MLQSAIPVLVCITKCYSSDATQVPLATTKYCSSTTKYHRVLPQNNFVQQKKCYSSTTLHYKVINYYSSAALSTAPALQSITPALVCATKCYSSST